MTTLQQAYSVTPMTPAKDATAQQQRDFFRERAAMFSSVARTDRDHRWEALACVWLEQEKVDQIEQALKCPK
ncbi:AMED_5909 family protein [Actinocrispum wychmicini]|uniref:AMED_5909 family protein n=1 Tax=Actinocrispum wychmicini TaxID=1213861 RepID=UPI00104CC667|nr:AMED_5909 family protein [Actinocrispum wychmicini]